MASRFLNNEEKHRFELHVGDSFAFANYRIEGGSLFIDKVEAPSELRGTGAASTLMQCIVEAAKKSGLTVVPICPYAVKWLQREQKPQPPKP